MGVPGQEKAYRKSYREITSVWHRSKWRSSGGFSGRNHIPLPWSFYLSYSTMNLGDPCSSCWLEEVQPLHSEFTLYRSWALAPASEVGINVFTRMSGITMSQFHKRHLGIFQTLCAQLQTCGMADGGFHAGARGDKKIYFLLTWAFPFPALKNIKDHPISRLKCQSLYHCLRLKDLLPRRLLVLDFLFSGTTCPCWRLSRAFLMGCITSQLDQKALAISPL